jgi:hypothetical protein
MSWRRKIGALFICAILFIANLSLNSPVGAQNQTRKRRAKDAAADARAKKSAKKNDADESGTPVLWREPVDIAARDLYWGPGGEAMKPDLSRVTFLEQETKGHSLKYRVRDGAGREWVAKIGDEAQSETAAVRLVWAVGYVTEINYLVPHVRIEGKGEFDNVRFEARPSDIKRLRAWKWRSNPFVGTTQMQGLKVLMLLLDNWDIKDANNKILRKRTRDGVELQYIISDLGATFGKTGNALPFLWRLTRSRNDPKGYVHSKFITKVKNGRVDFHYNGKERGLFKDITIAQAVWIGDWLARLSERQIADAFRAANYRPDEVRILTAAVKSRINELSALRRR